jgi:hypothetical protein
MQKSVQINIRGNLHGNLVVGNKNTIQRPIHEDLASEEADESN